jgi:hypothetical protein
VPASDRRPADLRRAINAQIGLLTADEIPDLDRPHHLSARWECAR